MTRIGILIGSTRPGRKGEQVARWVHERAARRGDAAFEVIDLLDHPLPHLDEPLPALTGRYEHRHTRAWAETVTRFDGFVMITPEYNASIPGVLKNAIDYLYAEWTHKAVGFVSYGAGGGIRAARQLRTLCELLQMGVVTPQVSLSLHTDFEDLTTFKPGAPHLGVLDALLDHVVARSADGGTATPTQRETDEAAIRHHIDGVIDAIQAKDLDALRRSYATDVVSFDIDPPLQHVGIDAKLKNWANVFAFFQEVTYEVRDLMHTVGEDVAFTHGFGRLSGTLSDGTAAGGMWVRVTFGFRKIDSAWLITHDQVSVPLDILGGKGVVDLEP
ncbi:NAD(P)H-dependent oxidoreductase [Streptomyces roseofulvus]|uniref:NAD(P)H-dependent oxidoreductase n=2 Tax=Streptomyces TaxID=1883 RepID=A0ABU4KI98_9ACTN|nr:NAD(P)H-dependent oxidoreductase [Streptomyces roseolus]MDX2297503.1 NAD(P)H-dependent oxidoreductase [Streptomyces roseolus]